MDECNSKEFNEMKEKRVYGKICQSDLPDGHIFINNNRVFKMKFNRNVCAHLVVRGYSQVPGVDFEESCAPSTSKFVFY
jgi:hypothetical protein